MVVYSYTCGHPCPQDLSLLAEEERRSELACLCTPCLIDGMERLIDGRVQL